MILPQIGWQFYLRRASSQVRSIEVTIDVTSGVPENQAPSLAGLRLGFQELKCGKKVLKLRKRR